MSGSRVGGALITPAAGRQQRRQRRLREGGRLAARGVSSWGWEWGNAFFEAFAFRRRAAVVGSSDVSDWDFGLVFWAAGVYQHSRGQ